MTQPKPSSFAQKLEAAAFGILFVGWMAFGVKIIARADLATPQGASDFTCYYLFGQAAWAGGRLYEVETVEGRRTPYPPPFACLAAALALMPYKVSLAVFYVASLSAFLISLRLALVMADPLRADRRAVAAFLIGILAYPFLKSELGHGQANAITLLGVSLCLWCAARGAGWSGGLGLTLATGIKPFFITLLPYFGYKRAWTVIAAWSIGAVAFYLIIPAAMFGPSRVGDQWRQWYERVLRPGAITGQPSGFYRDQGNSLEQVLYRFYPGTDPITSVAARHWILVRAIPIVTAMAVAILLICRGRLRELSADVRLLEYGSIVAATLVLTPLNQRHHYVGIIWPVVAGWSAWRGHSRHPTVPGGLTWMFGLTIVAITGLSPQLARWSGFFIGTFVMFWGLIILRRQVGARGEASCRSLPGE